MKYIKIGSPEGDGPIICDFGLMHIDGDVCKIKFWDNWPEKEISFNHMNPAERDAALVHCKTVRDIAKRQAAERAARPWWRKLWEALK